MKGEHRNCTWGSQHRGYSQEGVPIQALGAQEALSITFSWPWAEPTPWFRGRSVPRSLEGPVVAGEGVSLTKPLPSAHHRIPLETCSQRKAPLSPSALSQLRAWLPRASWRDTPRYMPRRHISWQMRNGEEKWDGDPCPLEWVTCVPGEGGTPTGWWWCSLITHHLLDEHGQIIGTTGV